jgi:carboxyl-terminal processing protease
VRKSGLRLPLLAALFPLAVVLVVGPARADQPSRERGLDQVLLVQVAAAALAFMAPRTLQDIPVPVMALWGLRSLSAIDPGIAPAVRGDAKSPSDLLVLGPQGKKLLSRQAPDPNDTNGWGEAIGQAVRAAWDNSDAVKRAGTQLVIRDFFNELFAHMDPYSRYAPPQEAEADRIRRAGNAGVGLTPALRGGGFVVGEIQAGGPAAQAGIRPGERILAVDGQSTQGADLQALDALLAGPEQTLVTLTLRGRDEHVRDVVLERDRLPPETVYATRARDMLVLQIVGFSRNTASRLAQELIRGLTPPSQRTADYVPVRGVVVDLRGNRGGVLQQAVAVAAMLQADGIVAVTSGRDPQAAHVFLASGKDMAAFLPVVVLVDGRSASAAEIVAASLADQRRAVVVGSSTLGKGLVQAITPLPDGGELMVSWSRVLAPLGWPIQGLGVLPQVCASLGALVLSRQLDALAHGTQLMAAALARSRAARPTMTPAEMLEIRANCPAAEGGEGDMAAARALIDNPTAYAAALLSLPPGSPARLPVPQGLTQNPGVSN